MTKYKFEPNFDEMLKVLKQEKPSRPVLFELFMNDTVYEIFAGYKGEENNVDAYYQMRIDAFCNGGYDYATVNSSDFSFPIGERHTKNTISLNDGNMISDEKSFDLYKWPNPENFDYSRLDRMGNFMPDGMKLMVMGPSGVLENTIALIGYENLCYMLADDETLAERIFNEVGKRLLRYYEISAEHDAVGMIMVNDDWGFNTQTFLSPSDMRKYVFPWHKKIVEVAHKQGKPAILHSCGYAEKIMDDIIDDIEFDGKHSFEDDILSVEDSYKRWGNRIGIIGGIDVDFLIRSTPEDIKKRCNAMLDLADDFGSYALGSGNSIPTYVPYENYKAMIECAHKRR